MRLTVAFLVLPAVYISAGAIGAGEADVAKVDFARDIRPILANHCWSCHGPDENARQADLRLDLPQAANAELADGTRAIVPGNAAASALVARIEAGEESERMPPADSKKPLDDQQKRLLRAWVEQGAQYTQHWAFTPPERPTVPVIENSAESAGWPRSAIDAFVLDRLAREGLKPAGEAERETLLRRVTLDLTGLPPTLAQLDAFLADASPDAYEKQVDRLLASPRYAERMALVWLDAARYADTNGYNNDEDRSQWPWRDWVIDAFARNLPFDRFILEQLAGDLLPDATQSQLVATAFNRNHGITTEGGLFPEEYRVEYVADRVHTTATVLLGLSLQCARCHDHKFDPITQKEYYQFFAYFNQVNEPLASYSNYVAAEPFIKVASPDQQARLDALEKQRQELEQQILHSECEAEAALAGWKQSLTPDQRSNLAGVGLSWRLPLDETSGDVVGDAVDAGRKGTVRGQVNWTAGHVGGALEFDGNTFVELGQLPAVDGSEPFTISAWVFPTTNEPIALVSKMDDAAASRGLDVLLEGGKVVCHLIHHWPDNAIKVSARQPTSLDAWHHILVAYDGSRKAAGLKVYVDGKPEALDVLTDSLQDTIVTDKPWHLGKRQTSLAFKGKLDEVQFYGIELSEGDAVRLAADQPVEGFADLLDVPAPERTAAQQAQLRRLFLDHIDPDYRRLKSELADAAGQRQEVEKSLTPVMIMRDMPEPRETFVLVRGQYDQPGDRADPGVPQALSSLPEGAPHNRIGLAEWLVHPSNPLTARVAVNRWWQMYFGAGLVETVEDFGVQGAMPSHPELLDFLATELVRTGWDVKAMQRLIVTSATYRQSSRATRELLDRDPKNRLLARGPRSRLPAEMVRDNALAISGLLRGRIGGPSVKPYQPAGLWEEVSVEHRAKYVPDQGDGLYRRSMYTFWKRTCPPPSMLSFDAPTRETCLARRDSTNTPLQALVLLNDPTYLEAARKLAERITSEGLAAPEERLALAFRLAVSRRPLPAEERALLALYQEALARFHDRPDEGAKLLAIGTGAQQPTADAVLDASIDAAELAAWTTVASTILNLDETITKR